MDARPDVGCHPVAELLGMVVVGRRGYGSWGS